MVTFVAIGRLPLRVVFPLLLMTAACSGNSAVAPTGQPGSGIQDDASLFRLITQSDPLASYALFPNAEEFTAGRLNGSEAHRPIVRVSLNARAISALQMGRLQAGSRFPDGSIVVKEVKASAGAQAATYAVMYRDATNRLASNGWVWAEFSPSGSVQYAVSNRGSACTSCHQRERGPQNDLVRTFERQP
jgi:hypothetical protein